MTATKLIEGAIPKSIRDAFAHHGDHVDTAEQLAAIADVDVETVQDFLNDPASVKALVAYRTKLEAKGDLKLDLTRFHGRCELLQRSS